MSAPTRTEPRGYARRQPELTSLYALIAAHLATFRDHVRETYERGLPRYVDALACPCGGRLRFIALVTDRETAAEPSSDPYAVAPPDAWFDPEPPECFDLPPPDW